VMATTRHHFASHTLGPISSWDCKTNIHGMFHRDPVVLTSNCWKMDGKQNNGWKIDGNGWKNEWKWPGRIGNLGQVDLSTPPFVRGFDLPKMVAMETLSYCSQDWARGALPSLRTNRTEPRFVWVKKTIVSKHRSFQVKCPHVFKDKTWQDHLIHYIHLHPYYSTWYSLYIHYIHL
jgi:hypothetical protein